MSDFLVGVVVSSVAWLAALVPAWLSAGWWRRQAASESRSRRQAESAVVMWATRAGVAEKSLDDQVFDGPDDGGAGEDDDEYLRAG